MDNGTKRTSWVCQKANGTAMCLMSMLLGLLLCVVSCQKDDTLTSEKEGTVSLLVNLGTPQLSVSSRGVSDDPKNEQNTWTNWDLLVDGSRFYRVTMLIVDSNNQLVAIKDWNDIANSLPTHVSTTLTGLQSNTTYRMIVVANYSSYDTWGGLTAFPDIANLTVGSNVSSTITNLNNYQLPNADTDYIAAKQPQPLSLVQEFTTPASGQMEVEGELVRTYARFRIEIANRSEKYKLTVNDLALGSATSKFGYRTEPLLMVDDDQIPASDGNLSVSSTDAMTPFTALEVPTLNDASGNSKVAFDAYIYECKNTSGFEYSLNVGYPISTTTTKTVYEKKGTGTTKPSSGLYYMIGYGSNNYYLTADGTSLTGTRIASNVTELDATQYEQVIWKVTMSGNSIQIMSVLDDKYINISSSSVSLGSSSSLVWDSNYRIYKSISNGLWETPYYIYANNTSVRSSSRNSTSFTFYEVTKTTDEDTTGGGATKEVVVPLETIIDGVATPTHIIRRNDFINVLVTVSYNENTGTIDFYVKDWETGGGDVEFN